METAIQTEKIAAQSAENCLNCAADLRGNFCHECGQECAEPFASMNETVGELLNEFTKFDSKLLKSFWYLIIKPGFLTVEYADGRRTAFLQPIKLYLTLNFFLFLLAGWFDPIQFSEADLEGLLPGRTLKI